MQPFDKLRAIGLWGVLTLLFAFLAVPASAQTFPKLTGRVVDNAKVLSAPQVVALEAKLKSVEETTGHQLVVATIADMQGYPLEDYGYQLGRNWQIGGKGENDGVVLFIAPNEPAGKRGPRIEVGYGLEPVLTDATSSGIINETMMPLLRAGDIYGALDAGAGRIGQQIALTPEEAAKRAAAAAAAQQQAKKQRPGIPIGTIFFGVVILVFFVLPMLARGGRGKRYRGRGSTAGAIGEVLLWTAINAAAQGRGGGGGSSWGGGGGGGWGGGGGGGGFSGGGGSFGGGGASGGW